jgi:hypothetical protein
MVRIMKYREGKSSGDIHGLRRHNGEELGLVQSRVDSDATLPRARVNYS